MKRDVEFLYEIGTLRFLHRQWRQFLNPDVANIAEHTLRVAWLALLIAKQEGGNEERVLKLAMVHDVGESRSVDVTYISRQYVERNERLAVADTFEDTTLGAEMTSLWEEVELRETLESKIVKDADNLDIEIELMEQRAKGEALPEVFAESRGERIPKLLFTKTAKKLFTEIRASSPHDWHHLSPRNRMNGGDWKDIR